MVFSVTLLCLNATLAQNISKFLSPQNHPQNTPLGVWGTPHYRNKTDERRKGRQEGRMEGMNEYYFVLLGLLLSHLEGIDSDVHKIHFEKHFRKLCFFRIRFLALLSQFSLFDSKVPQKKQ